MRDRLELLSLSTGRQLDLLSPDQYSTALVVQTDDYCASLHNQNILELSSKPLIGDIRGLTEQLVTKSLTYTQL